MIEFPKESVFRVDHATEERQAFINESYLDARRRKALEYLGRRWVLHPDNRITRLEKPYRPVLWQ